MSVNLLMNRPIGRSLRTCESFSKRYFTEKVKTGILGEIGAEETPQYEVELKYTQEEVDRMRLKTRLSPEDRNKLMGQKPYEEGYEYYHNSVWYRKKMMGKYGIEAAGFSPAIAWPTKAEIEDQLEWERVAYPVPIQTLWKQFEEKKIEEALAIKKREEEIDKSVAQFDKWRAALKARIDKKEAEILAAKQKREKVLQEVRERFGYYVDSRDERFKELLAQKEKEDKKKKKEEKKKKAQEKLAAFIAKQEEEAKARKAAEAGDAPKTENAESDNKSSEKGDPLPNESVEPKKSNKESD